MDHFTRKKIPYLIVDTSAFIKNAAVHDLCENVLTVQEVVKEITSKRQIRRLVVLPYDLIIKDTFPEHVAFITEFSKKTGDYPSLSATDIQVMALTYQLEKEKIGIEHLQQEPVKKPTVEPYGAAAEDVVGFYCPKKGKAIVEEDMEKKIEEEDSSSNYDSAEEEIPWEDEEEENFKEPNSDEILKNVTGSEEIEENDVEEEDNEEVEDDDEEEDDEEGWITPSNIKQIQKKVTSVDEEDIANVTVACLTTDFAMQNVLKQIGLNVVSLDGKVIKELRTYILRCYGCFKTTSIMTKVFCPNCGNKTLKKVAVSVDPDGTQRIHINYKRPLTARGKKFSLPKPQGGKHAKNPILCEDQPMPQQRPSRVARARNNPLNDDYIAGYSPFVVRDVTSKSAMLGIRPHEQIRHWMRRNPNESHKKSGKKKH